LGGPETFSDRDAAIAGRPDRYGIGRLAIHRPLSLVLNLLSGNQNGCFLLSGLNGVQQMKKVPNDVDRNIGKRIKSRRLFLGYNQQFLAESIGVSYQQVQKYENGTDRVGASRLFAISKSLDVPVGFFYGEGASVSGLSPDAEQENQILQRTMATEEARSLILSFGRIRDPELRAKVIDLAELLADAKLTGKTRSASKARPAT